MFFLAKEDESLLMFLAHYCRPMFPNKYLFCFLVRSNALDVIVLDSVAALVTKQELDGEIGDSTVGAQARLMSAAMRKLTSIIAKARTTCIFTNQIREKIGVMFGNPEKLRTSAKD